MVIQKPEVKFTKIFINNEWHTSVSGKTFPTINPCDGSKITDVEEGDKADIYKAVEAARNAFQLNSPWRTMDASARGRLLNKLADLMDRDKDYFARLECLDNGKTYGFASFECDFSANAIRYCAGFCDKLHGKTIPSDGDVFAYTRLDSLGVVGLIMPWNYPVLLEVCGVAQALCAGNCVVLKPAEQTPLTSLYLASLVKEAGFPPGVFNVVPGYGPTAGAALTEHMDVDKVSFTGSLEVGRIIQEASAKSNLKKLTLELGGKSPLIICADADLDVAAPIAVEACFINHGQTCAAGTRTFVHKSIYDKFVEKCAKLAAQRKVGDPFQEDTVQGPQIDEEQFHKILNYIQSGLKEGATLKTGGRRFGHVGYFIEPTVFADVKDHMTIAREEIFGPVMQILKFSTLDEVIKRANGTNYGLAAGIITNDINTAQTLAQALRAGLVWVNTYMALAPQIPFGGYKESGIGRSFGEDGIRQYLEIKSVVTKIPKKNC